MMTGHISNAVVLVSTQLVTLNTFVRSAPSAPESEFFAAATKSKMLKHVQHDSIFLPSSCLCAKLSRYFISGEATASPRKLTP